ncbi:MAG: BatA domain-containing protein [Kiritimatiellia bacterium]
MTFLFSHPLFLSLLPLALAPVLFHLFFRIRRKAVAFSTFMFFHRLSPRLNARRKVRDWLILLLRVLALAFLLLALSGPLITAAGRGGRTAAVFVLDNSASLSRRAASGGTLLDAAKAAAATALGTLQAGDSAALLLTVRDPAAPAAGGLNRDRDALRAALKAVPPTEAAGQPADALARALALLANAGAARREIHVFTDLQENEWARPASAVAAPPGLSLRFHRLVPADPPPNATLLALSLPPARRLASRRLPLSVRVRAGAQAVPVLINWREEGGAPGALEARLAANEEKAVVLPLAPREPGLHIVPVWLEGDGFEADNRAVIAFDVEARQSVLFLGARAEFGFLPAALAPGGDAALSGLAPVFAEPAGFAEALALKPLLAVVSWSRLKDTAPLADSLRSYVSGGGRLLALPDPAAPDAPLPGLPWLGATAGAPEKPAQPVPLMVLDEKQPLFDSLRDPEGHPRLRQVRVNRFHPLTAGEDATALLGLEDGRALLTRREEGKGGVYVCGLALEGTWSSLPLKPAFLPLIQNLALGDRPDSGSSPALLAGQSIPAAPPGAVRLLSDTAPPIEWRGEAADLPVPSRAGLWTLESGTNRLRLAVSVDPGEGQFRELQAAPVPAALGLPHTVEPLRHGQDLAARLQRDRKGLSLFHPFLIACLLALLAESLLANPRIKES